MRILLIGAKGMLGSTIVNDWTAEDLVAADAGVQVLDFEQRCHAAGFSCQESVFSLRN